MSIDIPLELDTGPISWVKPEIEASLGRVLEGIQQQRQQADAERKRVLARELHAVAGAFELVGVEGLAVLVREFEWHFSAPSPSPAPLALDKIERGVRRLLAHLQEMASGAPAVPVRFLPEYLALGKIRGAQLGPADLFFPDLSRRPPRSESAVECPPTEVPSLLLRKRREFQQGLLTWLRGGPQGLVLMGSAIASIEEAYPLPAQRAFWWSTRALLRAVEVGLLEPTVALKQLMARVDLQIRRFAEGSTRVADRLRREVLYHLARSEDGDPLVDAVKSLYELNILIPKRVPVELDYVAIHPILESLKAAVARAKDRWGTAVSMARGRDRDEFFAAVEEIGVQTQRIGSPDFARLGQALVETVRGVADTQPSDDLSIEIASTLILIETAAQQIAALPKDFHLQVDAAIKRLRLALSGAQIPPELHDPAAEALTRKAQERATIAQVVREIRNNMRAVEQALDAAFRDPSATEDLGSVPTLLTQVSGALQILGWTRANDILTETASRLLAATREEQPLAQSAIQDHADILAGLSFYIDAKEQREHEAEGLLADLERRLRGETPAKPVQQPLEESVEASMAGHRKALRQSLGAAAKDQPLSEQTRDVVLAIKHDAELLADRKLLGAADSALAAIDQGQTEKAALSSLLELVDPTKPVPEVSVETQRLAQAQDAERDTALLEIFCEEAREVVQALEDNSDSLRLNPQDRAAQANVRRAFHTLKGSGRMVGLHDFGEAAWQAEKLLNAILESDRAMAPHELAFVDQAREHFQRWVQQLTTEGRAEIDLQVISDLVAACERREMPSVTPSLPTEPAATAVPSTQPAPLAQGLSWDLQIDASPAPEPLSGPVDGSRLAAQEATAASSSAETSALASQPEPEELVLPSEPWASEEDIISIDGVAVPRTLFAILVDEARAHLQTLEEELALLQFDPSAKPGASMIRAAHTLCGIHRTAGFHAMGELAAETEHALVAMRDHEVDATLYPIIAQAVASMRTAALRIQTQTSMQEEERRAFAQALNEMRAFNARQGARRIGAEQAALALAQAEVSRETQTQEAAPAESKDRSSESLAESQSSPEPRLEESALEPLLAKDGGTKPQQLEEQAVESTDASPPTVSGMVLSSNVVQLPRAPSFKIPVETPLPASTTTAPTLALVPTPSMPRTSEGDPLTDMRDEIDEQVLPVFLEEAQELYPAANEQVRQMRARPEDPQPRATLKRILHTLKGSARMAGAMRLGEITHMLETQIIEAPTQPEPSFFEAVDEALDDIAFLLDRHGRGEHNAVLPRYRRVPPSDTASAADEAAVLPTQRPAAPAPATAATTPASQAATIVSPAIGAATTPPALPASLAAAESAYLRVRSEALETVSDEAGEIAITRARIESELRELKTGLMDLTSAVVRLRSQLRELEIQGETQIQSRLDKESPFDPLEFDRYTRFQELTRSLAEAVNDVDTVQQNLLKNLADADSALAAQMRLSRSVQMRLQAMRTVPFSTLSDRLYRVLRQTAKELGKRANLDIRGGRIEMDRGVIDRLGPVIEHLVRNALAHGIEAPGLREQLGKPSTGEMVLSVTQQGNEVVIELADDGAGLPLARIEQRARAMGLIEPRVQLSEGELTQFIFQPGFSTAEQVSAIAGRGVGMDVVRNEIASLGGRVDVRTSTGQGTTFSLRVPLSLAVTQVLLVRTGDSLIGIPASLIETVRQVRTSECKAARQLGRMVHMGQPIPYLVLTSLYHKQPVEVADTRSHSVAILRSGDLVAAFELEAVIGNQEVVSKPYGPQLARLRGLAGLTVLGDGSIVLLYNPLQLMPSVARIDTLAGAAKLEPQALAPVPPDKPSGHPPASPALEAESEPHEQLAPARPESAAEPKIPLVLVVDDSLTVRKITTRLLEREGYRVLTAKDGLDALQVLADHQPDVILLDIEMPRMDGFEFTRTLRSGEQQRAIPIIMITSRTADKHRQHAKELGVEEYLGKPYQDEQLLTLVARYSGGMTH